ncbi:MAG: Hsp20/alpha crystallin family protein [Desulfotomaculales bacterium]
MSAKPDVFELLQKIPFLDEDFFREIADADWLDPTGVLRRLAQARWPPVDVAETADQIVVTVAVPGLRRPGDVRVELKGNVLTLEGEVRPATRMLPVITVHRQERREGEFKRTVTLPVAVNPRGAVATYRRGILEIRLTKLLHRAETLAVDFAGS